MESVYRPIHLKVAVVGVATTFISIFVLYVKLTTPGGLDPKHWNSLFFLAYLAVMGVWMVLDCINTRLVFEADQLVQLDWKKSRKVILYSQVEEFKSIAHPFFGLDTYKVVGAGHTFRISTKVDKFDEFKLRMEAVLSINERAALEAKRPVSIEPVVV